MILYREANIFDWDKLAEFRNNYGQETLKESRDSFSIDFIDNSQKNIGILFVAEKEGQIVGYGRVGLFDPLWGEPIYGQLETPKGYYTKGVLVDKSVRGHGVGIELTRMRSSWVKAKKSKLYCILQSTNLISVAMHLKVGFIEVEKNLVYPWDSGNERTGVLYCLTPQ